MQKVPLEVEVLPVKVNFVLIGSYSDQWNIAYYNDTECTGMFAVYWLHIYVCIVDTRECMWYSICWFIQQYLSINTEKVTSPQWYFSCMNLTMNIWMTCSNFCSCLNNIQLYIYRPL